MSVSITELIWQAKKSLPIEYTVSMGSYCTSQGFHYMSTVFRTLFDASTVEEGGMGAE